MAKSLKRAYNRLFFQFAQNRKTLESLAVQGFSTFLHKKCIKIRDFGYVTICQKYVKALKNA